MDDLVVIYISGLVAAFFTYHKPADRQFLLGADQRGLYLFAFVMMTAKFVIMNAMVDETEQGVVAWKKLASPSGPS